MKFRRKIERRRLNKCKTHEEVLQLINTGKVRGKTAQPFLREHFGLEINEEAIERLKDMGLWE